MPSGVCQVRESSSERPLIVLGSRPHASRRAVFLSKSRRQAQVQSILTASTCHGGKFATQLRGRQWTLDPQITFLGAATRWNPPPDFLDLSRGRRHAGRLELKPHMAGKRLRDVSETALSVDSPTVRAAASCPVRPADHAHAEQSDAFRPVAGKCARSMELIASPVAQA